MGVWDPVEKTLGLDVTRTPCTVGLVNRRLKPVLIKCGPTRVRGPLPDRGGPQNQRDLGARSENGLQVVKGETYRLPGGHSDDHSEQTLIGYPNP